MNMNLRKEQVAGAGFGGPLLNIWKLVTNKKTTFINIGPILKNTHSLAKLTKLNTSQVQSNCYLKTIQPIQP